MARKHVSHCDTFILECQGGNCVTNILMSRKPGKKMAGFVTLRLETSLKASLEAAAEKEQRSLGQLLRILLMEGLERRGGGKEPPAKASSKTRTSR